MAAAEKPRVAAGFNKVPLPPIGVFWDIENCQIPKGKSVIDLVQCIRENFVVGYCEAEFDCVCDITKESDRVIKELNEAQVTVVHVPATAKNAADGKLCHLMRRFADTHGQDSAVVLISGDINFAPELTSLRYRTGTKVIIVHNGFASPALLALAHSHVSFQKLTADIPLMPVHKNSQSPKPCKLIVTNLPNDQFTFRIRNRLQQISDNCGGRVLNVTGDQALMGFPNHDSTLRARKRMDHADVYGNKIMVNFPTNGTNCHDHDDGLQPKGLVSRQEADRGTFNLTPKSSRDAHFEKGPQGKKSRFPLPLPVPLNLHVNGTDSYAHSWSADVPSFGHQRYSGGMLSLDGDSKLSTSAVGPSLGGAFSYQDRWTGLPPSWKDPHGGSHLPGNQLWKKDRSWHSLDDNVGRAGLSDGSREASLLDGSERTPDGARRIRGCHGPRNDGNVGRWSQTGHRQPWSGSLQPPFQGHLFLSVNRGNTPSPRLATVTGVLQAGLHDQFRPGSAASGSSSPNFQQALCLHDQRYDTNNASQDAFASEPVELLITNLDQNIDANEMKRYLQLVFRDYVMVLHVSVNLSSDGNLIAGIRVPSMQHAQYAISQLHRCRIGSKRILINVANDNNGPPISVLRSQVVGLLTDVPGKRLPLFKFRELYERRYNTSIGTSELHRIYDLVSIEEHALGRMVVLNDEYRNTPSPASSDGSREVQEILEMARCDIHCHDQNKDKGWAEKEQAAQLPNVIMSVKTLATHIHSLLQSHAYSIPLNSLPICYECEFGPLNIVSDGGVPLEHLVTCVPGVHIVKGPTGVRLLEWTENKTTADQLELRISPPLLSQLSLFSREIVDLLKNVPYCRIPFTKFIPAYHHHFGRQCRVADYGYTRLLDLLEALSHVVQILGDGNKRILTLTRRAQVKRFTADLLRVLKAQVNKQVTLREFPEAYEKCVGKAFDIYCYGVCHFQDMLPDVADGAVVISRSESGVTISIPRREQTEVEMDRTKQFSLEVIDLLRHSPRCRLNFTKFIPAYHHHFGRQCRVADYGFMKLIELFESIPDVVDTMPSEEDVDEKVIQLVQPIMLQVLAEQASHVLRSTGCKFIPLDKFMAAYIQLYGYSLCPEDFDTTDVRGLLNKIEHIMKVVDTPSGPVVTVVDRSHVLQLSMRVKQILLPVPGGQMLVDEFYETYKRVYGSSYNLNQITSSLKDVVKIVESGTTKIICLLPLQMLGKDIAVLLHERGRLLQTQFETAYMSRFGKPCLAADYGFPSMSSVFQALPDVVSVRGRGSKKTLVLNREETYPWLREIVRGGSAVENVPAVHVNGHLSVSGPVDLLADSVPSRLPSPDIRPMPVSPYHHHVQDELIRFDSPSSGAHMPNSNDRCSPAMADMPITYMHETSHEAMYFVLQPTARPASPFFPPPSLVPPVPLSWMYPALPPLPAAPKAAGPSTPPPSACENGLPGSPVSAEVDSSENEMSTPPCVRELIAPSSAESTPTHASTSGGGGGARDRYRTPRIAAQFSHPPVLPPSGN